MLALCFKGETGKESCKSAFEDILTKYSDVFKDELGTLKCVMAILNVDPKTKLSVDPKTKLNVDPKTKLSVDPKTKLSVDLKTKPIFYKV